MVSPESNILLSIADSDEGNVDTIEDDETQDDTVPKIPIPPTPSKPRLREDGTVPPE